MPGQGHLAGLARANDWLPLRVLLSADAPPQRGFSVPFCATPACHELLRYQESHGSERGVGFSALHYCFIGHGHGRGTSKQAMAAAERMLEISSAHGLGLAEIATSNGILPLHVAAPCAPPRVVALLVLGYPAGMSMADSKGKLPIIRAESQSAPSTTCLASLYKACRRKDQTKLESMVADVLGREPPPVALDKPLTLDLLATVFGAVSDPLSPPPAVPFAECLSSISAQLGVPATPSKKKKRRPPVPSSPLAKKQKELPASPELQRATTPPVAATPPPSARTAVTWTPPPSARTSVAFTPPPSARTAVAATPPPSARTAVAATPPPSAHTAVAYSPPSRPQQPPPLPAPPPRPPPPPSPGLVLVKRLDFVRPRMIAAALTAYGSTHVNVRPSVDAEPENCAVVVFASREDAAVCVERCKYGVEGGISFVRIQAGGIDRDLKLELL
ncbi:hypothetical protein TeGR_g5023 [Tetraparma gracilis]|uniref:RRM domain-containing protein n=1 Tax=Tetraparma gracilis TaxID=2962635 RepID=A0ABQ6MWH1_9STRA|nr:hypothetical protein TeGR_g5023 [Tetraparma gracilis]